MKERTYWQWVKLGTSWYLGILFLLIAMGLGFVMFQTTRRQSRLEEVVNIGQKT